MCYTKQSIKNARAQNWEHKEIKTHQDNKTFTHPNTRTHTHMHTRTQAHSSCYSAGPLSNHCQPFSSESVCVFLDSIPPTVAISFLSHYSAATFTPHKYIHAHINTHPPTHPYTHPHTHTHTQMHLYTKQLLLQPSEWKTSSGIAGMKTAAYYLNNKKQQCYSVKGGNRSESKSYDPQHINIVANVWVILYVYQKKNSNSGKMYLSVWRCVVVSLLCGIMQCMQVTKQNTTYIHLYWRNSSY